MRQCRVCGASEQPGGAALLRCGTCYTVGYCKPACQRRDQTRHRACDCVPSVATEQTRVAYNEKLKAKAEPRAGKNKKKSKKKKKKK